jgi:hypothetical protein
MKVQSTKVKDSNNTRNVSLKRSPLVRGDAGRQRGKREKR